MWMLIELPIHFNGWHLATLKDSEREKDSFVPLRERELAAGDLIVIVV